MATIFKGNRQSGTVHVIDITTKTLLKEHIVLNKERVKILARMKEIEDELKNMHTPKLENG